MDRDDQLRLVKRFYDEMWNRFDTTILDDLLDPDLRFRGSLGQEVVGHAEFAEYVELIRAFAPDFHNRVDETITEGDSTFARLTYSGTHLGEVFGRVARSLRRLGRFGLGGGDAANGLAPG